MRHVQRDMNAIEREFYERLDRDERIYASRCTGCERLFMPPRERCPVCDAGSEWEALSGRGTLHAFTWQERATRFAAPAVIGLVDMEEGVRAFGVVLAPFDELRIGQAVAAIVVRDDIGPPVVGFRPAGARGPSR